MSTDWFLMETFSRSCRNKNKFTDFIFLYFCFKAFFSTFISQGPSVIYGFNYKVSLRGMHILYLVVQQTLFIISTVKSFEMLEHGAYCFL